MTPRLRPAARLGLRVAYPLIRLWWLTARPRRRGVQCLMTRGDELLLVRHSYGDRRRWELPGGAVKRGERPLDAAVREIREELGVELSDWRPLGDVSVRIDSRRGALCCFAAPADGLELRLDEVEVIEARWFARDALPARLGRHVPAVIALAS